MVFYGVIAIAYGCLYSSDIAPIAQWLERPAYIGVVGGSSPSGRTRPKTAPVRCFCVLVRDGAMSREHARPRVRPGEILERRRQNYLWVQGGHKTT